MAVDKSKEFTRQVTNSKVTDTPVALPKYSKSFIALLIIAVVEFIIILYLLIF